MQIGCDIVEIKRFLNTNPKFMSKYFCQSEIEYINSKPNKPQTMAGLFSAKESVLKALGKGIGDGLSIFDIEISHNPLGQPFVKIHQEQFSSLDLRITISHTDENAMSVCVIC